MKDHRRGHDGGTGDGEAAATPVGKRSLTEAVQLRAKPGGAAPSPGSETSASADGGAAGGGATVAGADPFDFSFGSAPQAIDAGIAARVGAVTGADVSGARVHAGPAASSAAAEVGARAFTVGSDIVLGAGERGDDVGLMAHEAAHVAQQASGGAGLQRMALVPSGDAAEVQADQVAGAVVAGDTALIGPLATVAAGSIARAEPGSTPGGEAPAAPAAPAGPTPAKVAGKADSKRIVRVAWTIDDGPGAGTSPMKQALGSIPGTWYVQRKRVEEDPQGYAKLKQAQDAGSEIAIHSVHPSKEHVPWFPPGYGTIDEAMTHLGEFQDKLVAAGIRVAFTRLPGGLLDEIHKYLDARGFTGNGRSEAVRLIQQVTSADGLKAPSDEVWRAIQTFRSGLAARGLAEWGGAAPGDLPELQSWGAESSGMGGTDNVTGHLSDASREKTEALPDSWERRFEAKCAAATEAAPQALVVLTHDGSQGKNEAKTPKNATEATADITAMETHATQVGVRVEYYTMSQLYQLVQGAPAGPPAAPPP